MAIGALLLLHTPYIFDRMSEKFTIMGTKFGTSLEFSHPNKDPKTSEITGFSVTFRAENIEVSNHVDMFMNGPYLPKLFRELEENWRGWKGEKIWESLDGEFEIKCTCDSTGHITFNVRLRHPVRPGPWEVNGAIEVDAGHLESLSKAAAKFFAK